MWGIFALIGLFVAVIGGAMIGVGKKKNLDVEVYIIGGSVILAGGVALLIGALISAWKTLSTPITVATVIILIATCGSAALAAVAKKRIDNNEGSETDLKMYKERWLTLGIAGAICGGLLLIGLIWYGVRNSPDSTTPQSSQPYGYGNEYEYSEQ